MSLQLSALYTHPIPSKLPASQTTDVGTIWRIN